MVAGHLVKLQGEFIITSPAHSWIYKLYLFLTNFFAKILPFLLVIVGQVCLTN